MRYYNKSLSSDDNTSLIRVTLSTYYRNNNIVIININLTLRDIKHNLF